MESRFIELATLANRTQLTNGPAPTSILLPEADVSDMEYYIGQAKIILPVLGVNLLRSFPTAAPTSPATTGVPTSTADDSPAFEPQNGGFTRRSPTSTPPRSTTTRPQRSPRPSTPRCRISCTWAITGLTAAEVVRRRAGASKPNMGLTNWRGPRIKKSDVSIAKNYYDEAELRALNNLVEQYLVFAEGQAQRRVPMKMADWVAKLDGFLTLNDRDILTSAGKVSHELAAEHAAATCTAGCATASRSRQELASTTSPVALINWKQPEVNDFAIAARMRWALLDRIPRGLCPISVPIRFTLPSSATGAVAGKLSPVHLAALPTNVQVMPSGVKKIHLRPAGLAVPGSRSPRCSPAG